MDYYNCLRCGYTSINKSDIYRHLNRKKICDPKYKNINIDECKSHIKKIKLLNKLPQITPNYPICEYCQKTYTRKEKLLFHMKKCKHKPIEIIQTIPEQLNKCNNVNDTIIQQNNLLLEHISLLHEKINEQKQSFTEQNYKLNEKINEQTCTLYEQLNEKFIIQNKQLKQLEIKNTTNNQMNNVVNIGTFLNEKCSDAYNIEDLKDMIPCNLQILEDFTKRGYNEGTNYMIYNSIKDMTIYERPFHCLDVKRDIIHVKSGGVWQIDTELKCMRKLLFDVEKKLQLEYSRTCDKYENAGGDSALGTYLSKMQNVVWCVGYDYDESYRRIYNKLFKQVHLSKKQIKEYYNAI
jgi:hypothetical protein